MLLGDEGHGDAAWEPSRVDLVLDKTERLPRGEGGEGALASSIRPNSRTTASTGAVCTDTHNLF